jgi:cytochrome c
MRRASILQIALVLAALPAHATEALYREKGCMACHDTRTRVVGPAYSDVAKKYRPMPDGQARIVDSILNGSAKKWGPVRMYPNGVSEEEARQLAAWILTL